jgi:hypothetical protein
MCALINEGIAAPHTQKKKKKLKAQVILKI